MIDPWTATLEEARAAQESAGPGPEGPIFQWAAARRVESERSLVEGGDGFATLACIRSCVTHGLVAPEWLAIAFNRCYSQVLSCRVRSWDEAFGKPYPGKKIDDLRRRRELRFAVFNRVTDERELKSRAVDEALFEDVAAEFGIGKTLCSELYYEAKHFLLPPSRK